MQKLLSIVEKLPEYNIKVKNKREEMKRISIGCKAPTLGVVPKESKIGISVASNDMLYNSVSSFNM